MRWPILVIFKDVIGDSVLNLVFVVLILKLLLVLISLARINQFRLMNEHLNEADVVKPLQQSVILKSLSVLGLILILLVELA